MQAGTILIMSPVVTPLRVPEGCDVHAIPARSDAADRTDRGTGRGSGYRRAAGAANARSTSTTGRARGTRSVRSVQPAAGGAGVSGRTDPQGAGRRGRKGATDRQGKRA